MSREDIPRDRWSRPVIIPPGGGDPIAYTRASSIGSVLEDNSTLGDWKVRTAAIGLAQRPDLLALVAAYSGDEKPSRLNAVMKDALVAGGSESKANEGTAMHAFTEAIDNGINPGPVPPKYTGDIEAYVAAMQPWTVLDTEQFVVCDELQVAGTFDKLMASAQFTGGEARIGDTKTGKWVLAYGQGEIAVQLATYAHGQYYDPATGVRTPTGASHDEAFVIWLPVGEGKCELYRVDLVRGWEGAQLARDVHEWRKWNRKGRALFEKVDEIEALAPEVALDAELALCQDVDAVRVVWGAFKETVNLTDLKERCLDRVKALNGGVIVR